MAYPAKKFPDTRWSLILRLRETPKDNSATNALNELCSIYWQPLYAYLRRCGNAPDVAQDLVQGFLVQLIERNGFDHLDQTKGLFRQFLLTSLGNYLVSAARKTNAAKRGGRVELLSLDVAGAEASFQAHAADSLSPAAEFDRQWAEAVLTRALKQLEAEHEARGRADQFRRLKPLLAEASTTDRELAAERQSISASALAVSVHRLRRRLRELVIDELAQTVNSPAELENELQYFLSLWSK